MSTTLPQHHSNIGTMLGDCWEVILVGVNPFNARIVDIRQHLTSIDARFLRLKSVPALKELPAL